MSEVDLLWEKGSSCHQIMDVGFEDIKCSKETAAKFFVLGRTGRNYLPNNACEIGSKQFERDL